MKKQTRILFTTLAIASVTFVPTTALFLTSCNQQTIKPGKKVADLPIAAIQKIYDSYSVEIKQTNPYTYQEFENLFISKLKEYDNKTLQVLKDPEIKKAIDTKTLDINKIQSGHKVIVSPILNQKTQQFGLNIKVWHINGGYVEGKPDGNNTMQIGSFKEFSEAENEAQQIFFSQYTSKIKFTKKQSSSNYEQLKDVLTKNASENDYVTLTSPEVSKLITFVTPEKTAPNNTAISFKIITNDADKQVSLNVTLKSKITGNNLQTKKLDLQ